MAKINKAELADKIKRLEGLSDEQRSALLGLLHEQKKYGIVWEDKPEDVEVQMRRELPVLKEVKERAIISDDKDAPNHILIEGDNLHALTALSYTHAGKIDFIYIDPPYNTGNKDFVYNDSFVDKEDGYRHSKWLSFMDRRLRIAKQLMSEKGVIFISIDDNEVAQLKMLCDEVFGESNFVATFPWRKRTAKSDVPFGISQDYEWIITYAKSNKFVANTKGGKRKYFETPDFPNKPWRIHDLSKQTTAGERPNSFFTIVNPKNGKEYPANPNRTWAITEDTFKKYYADDRIVFPGDYNFLNISKPALRYWKKDDMAKMGEAFGRISVSTKFPDIIGMSQDGTKEITELFKTKIFSFPKPTSLLRFLISISTNSDDLILDFFSGSGTTLHATMKLNAEDGGHRKCILVTNNENNICEEVTYERNKRVINGYATPNGEVVDGLHSNNLRYYKTDFVPREKTNKNMRDLVAAATDMLCIKNDVYTEQERFGGKKLKPSAARYFDDGKVKMLVIYNELAIDMAASMIAGMDVEGKILVYVFSNSRYAYDDNFEEVSEKVELCALPAAIYDAYKKVIGAKTRTGGERFEEEADDSNEGGGQ